MGNLPSHSGEIPLAARESASRDRALPAAFRKQPEESRSAARARTRANHMPIVMSLLPRVVLETGLSRLTASNATRGAGSRSKFG